MGALTAVPIRSATAWRCWCRRPPRRSRSAREGDTQLGPLPGHGADARPGRDIGRLVEVAALVQALKKMGRDPAKEFNERLIAFMSAQQPTPSESVLDEAPQFVEPEPLDEQD